MVKVEIKKVKLDKIHLNPDNPRTITKQAMERLVKSLQDFPEMMELREIVVDETLTVLGGNMRTLALRQAGEKEVLAKICTGLTPEQKREFVIKDNAAFGAWDMDALANSWDDLPLIEWGVDLPDHWLEPGHALTDRSELDHRFDDPSTENPEIALSFICKNREQYNQALQLLGVNSQKQILDIEVLFNAFK